jgi:calcineurin-like phosphoesterase family protein
MKIWIITDTHFGHNKMIEFCGRPEGFEDLILSNIHRLVQNGDIIIHLGDFCIGSDEKWHQKFLTIANCKTILVRGNHDHKSDSWYIRQGWDMVCETFSNTYFGKNILFSHKPQADNGYDINIHGHFHNSGHHLHEAELLSIQNPKQKLLAIENTNLCPVLLETFLNK